MAGSEGQDLPPFLEPHAFTTHFDALLTPTPQTEDTTVADDSVVPDDAPESGELDAGYTTG
jgi:hypothetical protein